MRRRLGDCQNTGPQPRAWSGMLLSVLDHCTFGMLHFAVYRSVCPAQADTYRNVYCSMGRFAPRKSFVCLLVGIHVWAPAGLWY